MPQAAAATSTRRFAAGVAPINADVNADQALRAHGFSGEQLIGLSRKAANDALRRHGAHLDPDRFEELADYMLMIGVRYAPRFEEGHGIAIQTFLYRRMRIRSGRPQPGRS